MRKSKLQILDIAVVMQSSIMSDTTGVAILGDSAARRLRKKPASFPSAMLSMR